MPHTLLIVAVLVVVILLSQSVVSAKSQAPTTNTLSADPVNAFGCDLYSRLAGDHPNDNLFFSPFSMASERGSASETARSWVTTMTVAPLSSRASRSAAITVSRL